MATAQKHIYHKDLWPAIYVSTVENNQHSSVTCVHSRLSKKFIWLNISEQCTQCHLNQKQKQIRNCWVPTYQSYVIHLNNIYGSPFYLINMEKTNVESTGQFLLICVFFWCNLDIVWYSNKLLFLLRSFLTLYRCVYCKNNKNDLFVISPCFTDFNFDADFDVISHHCKLYWRVFRFR